MAPEALRVQTLDDDKFVARRGGIPDSTHPAEIRILNALI
jgi:hypothetical protein